MLNEGFAIFVELGLLGIRVSPVVVSKLSLTHLTSITTYGVLRKIIISLQLLNIII